MDTYNEIWNAVLSYCEQRVTETAFNLWIKKTEFVSFEAATITLRLPSERRDAMAVNPDQQHRRCDQYLPQNAGVSAASFVHRADS